MTNGRIEVITSVERRRRWSRADKERLVTSSLEPGASVSSIAREAGIHPGQLYGWRRELRVQQAVGFTPVTITPEIAPDGQVGLVGRGAIDIEFASGARVRITGVVDPAVVTATVAALVDRRRR
jgi:transposase